MVHQLRLHRFNVTQYHTMKRLGILSPGARVELLDGLITDMHRPTQRELDVIAKVAETLAERLGDGTTIHASPPAHPESYATFDPALMVHDWERWPPTAPLPLHRFSVAEYHRLLEVGIIDRSSETELIDGVVFDAPARAPRTRDVLGRLDALLSSFLGDHAIRRLVAPVQLGPYSEVRPDIAIVRPRPDHYAQGPPTAADTLLLVDVRDEGGDERQAVNWPVYARWGVKSAWLVDVSGRRLVAARNPENDAYTVVVASREHETISVLVDGIAFEVPISAVSLFGDVGSATEFGAR
jgi:Uma2 family endonuclease